MRCITKRTCEMAWIAAAQALRGSDDRELHNLVVEIEEPAMHSRGDLCVRHEVDKLLREHNVNPVFTVAETIFPAAIYKEEGVRGVFKTYPEVIYPAIKRPEEWGRYAYRLLRRKTAKGEDFNPLEQTINRLKAAISGRDVKRAIYELSLSEDTLDLPIALPSDRRTRGGPCLSHISLKFGRDERLYLTAMYRYHYFVERALGNYLGLAALQAFLCDQTGLAMGPLVCVSTYARLDDDSGWNATRVDALLDTCSGMALSITEQK